MPRGIPRRKDAQYNPVIISQSVDVSQQEVGQGPSRLMKSTGDAKEALDRDSVIKVMEQPYDKEKMAMLAFMNELVTIRVATTTDRNAEQCFEINVNGHMHFFRRGEEKTVPRFIVDRMLRLKPVVYTQREVVNAEGIREYMHDPHTGMKYDFSITRDDNPRGRDWQRAVLAEPG